MPYINKEQYEEYLALKAEAEHRERVRIQDRAREDAAERKYTQDILDYCEERRLAGDPVRFGE